MANATSTLVGTIVPGDTAVRLSALEAYSEEELKLQRRIVKARKYHDGLQNAQLTERLREFLQMHPDDEFSLNVCAPVVNALSERLVVDGFDGDDTKLLDWAWRIWQECNLDAMQDDVHEGALRDSEYFVMVDWDAEENRPIFVPHQRYTSVDAGGDGYGCMMFYDQDDRYQKPQFAVKQWTEATKNDIVERRNIYYPDRIEKYQRGSGAQWVRIGESIPWVDAEGKPLGIAVVPFTNKGMRQEASAAWPMQDAVNKSLIDLLSASDLTAFRIYVALGFIPTTDGKPPADDMSNWLKVTPGQIVGTTKPPSEASFSAIGPSELEPLMDLTHQLVLWLAMVTNTPVTRFISTKLVASDETLKEQEGPLLARVRSRQITFGNSWSKCMQLAAKLQNLYGEPSEDDDLPEDLDANVLLEPIWIEPQSRSQSERLDLLVKKQKLGIPRRQLWREAGYSQSAISKMQAEASDDREVLSNGQDDQLEDEQQQEGRGSGSGRGSGFGNRNGNRNGDRGAGNRNGE